MDLIPKTVAPSFRDHALFAATTCLRGRRGPVTWRHPEIIPRRPGPGARYLWVYVELARERIDDARRSVDSTFCVSRPASRFPGDVLVAVRPDPRCIWQLYPDATRSCRRTPKGHRPLIGARPRLRSVSWAMCFSRQCVRPLFVRLDLLPHPAGSRGIVMRGTRGTVPCQPKVRLWDQVATDAVTLASSA